MPKLVVLPGFLGSTMARVLANYPLATYWGDYVTFPFDDLNLSGSVVQAIPVASMQVQYLRLNDDGSERYPPSILDPGTTTAYAALRSYYDGLISYFRRGSTGVFQYDQETRADNWQVTVIPYDWRRRLAECAAEVKQRIADAGITDDYYILAHSQGGLVARMMWAAMSDAEKAHIKRIVTLGTPHWGSYTALQAMFGMGGTYSMVRTWYNRGAGINAVAFGIPGLIGAEMAPEIDEIILSWPALFEMMPNTYAPYDRPKFQYLWDHYYSTGRPFGNLTTAYWVGQALQTMQALAGPSTQPPDNILVSMAMRGTPTIDRVADVPRPSGGTMWTWFAGDGDDTVDFHAAQMRQGVCAEVYDTHTGALSNYSILRQARRFLLGLDPLPAAPPAPAVPEPQEYPNVIHIPGRVQQAIQMPTDQLYMGTYGYRSGSRPPEDGPAYCRRSRAPSGLPS